MVYPKQQKEHMFLKTSYKNRKEQVMDILHIPENTSLPGRVKTILELMDTLVQQAYIAGINRVQVIREGEYTELEDTGESAVLALNFSKDKGLCQ